MMAELMERWRVRRRGGHPTDPRHERGRRGEQLARDWLTRQGFVIEATNVRCPLGELDLVAREGATLCFVEVRTRTSQAYGGALASIRQRKRRHVVRAAQWYLKGRISAPEAVRFDVVSVDWQSEERPQLELVRGAFDAT